MIDELKTKWIGMGSAVAALLLFGALPYVSGKLQSSPLQLPLTSLVLQVFFVALATSLACSFKGNPRQRLGLNPPRLTPTQWFFILLGMVGLSQTLDTLIHLGGWADRGSLALFEEALSGVRGWTLAAAILGLGLAPAAGEEFLFRGLMLRSLIRKWGPGGALVASSLAFGLVHFDPVHSIAASFIGLYLGLVLLRTGSLIPALACHSLNNLIAVLSTALLSDSIPISAWSLPLGCAALGLGLLSIRGISPHDVYREPPNEPIKTGEG
jgi:membrane protease YdiL (CAAX protease family)